MQAVPKWKYWYCFKCNNLIERSSRTAEPRWVLATTAICPKCKARCDVCVWVLHCNILQREVPVPLILSKACETCDVRWECYSQRIPEVGEKPL